MFYNMICIFINILYESLAGGKINLPCSGNYSSQHHGIFCLFGEGVLVFWPCHVTCRILDSQPGIESGSPAVEAQSPNHGTTR